METYETGILSSINMNKFIKWFDAKIGTEYDKNEVDANEHYAVFFDLTQKEVERIREYEKNIKDTDNVKMKPFSIEVLDMSIPAAVATEIHMVDIINKDDISSYVISYDPEYGDYTHVFKTISNVQNIKAFILFMKINIDTGEIHTGDVYTIDKETMVGIDIMDFIQ